MIKGSVIEKSHWIIKSIKKNAIWKQPYLSKRDAETELQYQKSILKQGQSIGDWKIEERHHLAKSDGMEDFEQNENKMTKDALNNF